MFEFTTIWVKKLALFYPTPNTRKVGRGLFVGLALLWSSGGHSAFDFQLEVLSEDLQRPWGISHLGDGQMLITERHGSLRLFNGKHLSAAIPGVPDVYNAGQGGLLDVTAHPQFADNQLIYLTLSYGARSSNGTRLIRAQFNDNKLTQLKALFQAAPAKKQALHFAGRIAFLPDNTLVFGVGDGYTYKEHAQRLDSHLGKIIRLNDDGSVPADNPFVLTKGAKPEIYSYGHRNPQGVFFDHRRQRLFSNEHGPKGGDEINIIQPGLNYGWPAITYGIDYSGAVISELTHKDGMEQPLLQWTPSIAPSSMVVYYGSTFPELNGHILTTALKFTQLRVVALQGTGTEIQVKSQQVYLKEYGERIRDIELDELGRIYLITDSGKLWRLSKPTN